MNAQTTTGAELGLNRGTMNASRHYGPRGIEVWLPPPKDRNALRPGSHHGAVCFRTCPAVKTEVAAGTCRIGNHSPEVRPHDN